MRLMLIIATTATILGWPAIADEMISTVDGREILLRADGTYEEIDQPKEKAASGYRTISLEDLKLDINDLDGQNVEVRVKLGTFGDVVMLGDPKTMFDTNPVLADQSRLSREDRKRILRCDNGCNVTARGEVGQVMFQTGIILHSLQK